jgi:hypothetical protein
MKYNGNSIVVIRYNITNYLRRNLGIIEDKTSYRILRLHFLEVSGMYANHFDTYDKFFEWFCGLEDSEIRSILALEALGK